MCFFFFLLFLLSIPDHIATDGLRVQSNVAKHVQRRVCVRLRSKTWTVGVYYKGWFKMRRESASRCSRCWPDGGREEAFEWQKWNIDKTRGHKHTARLKMWPDGWHLISQCLLVSSFFSEEADFLLLISTLDISTLRLREHPSNPPPLPVPPPHTQPSSATGRTRVWEKKSVIYRALNLQRRSQSSRPFSLLARLIHLFV